MSTLLDEIAEFDRLLDGHPKPLRYSEGADESHRLAPAHGLIVALCVVVVCWMTIAAIIGGLKQ